MNILKQIGLIIILEFAMTLKFNFVEKEISLIKPSDNLKMGESLVNEIVGNNVHYLKKFHLLTSMSSPRFLPCFSSWKKH